MAEIAIERKPKQRWWPWALAALLLLAVIGTTWILMGPEGNRLGTDTDTLGIYAPGEPGGVLDQPVPPGSGPPEAGEAPVGPIP
jgi:hypothetical protein